MQKIRLKIKKTDPRAKIPAYGSNFAAGADLYALSDEVLKIGAGQTLLVHTGISAEIPEGYVGLVFARSGLATKKGIAPANKVGVIDSDYRGEIQVCLYNQSGSEQEIEPFERVAQLVIMPYVCADFEEAEELSDTERGTGGFGSTGRK